ncbi:hypothetical protein [Natronorarus salvus]|uniref:hypothetical protein n=1 Tax=Natronorarus salvus TaxID=3117733 RepID=UPI002F262690
MNTTSGSLMKSLPRSGRASLQIGLAVLGTLLILGSLVWFALVFTAMSPSESGFAEGLAIVVFGLYVLVGFVVLAAGLWIPQRDDDGIQFSPRQRRLLAYGAVAPVASVVVVPIGATISPPLTEPVLSILVACLVALVLSGPLATLLAVGLKLRSRIRR